MEINELTKVKAELACARLANEGKEMFEYVNQYYGVNACVGRRVLAYGKPGTIVKDFGHHIGIILDDEPLSEPGRYHPIDGITYGEVVDYAPPKLSSRKQRAKQNYRDFIDADYGHDFHEWLGISLPKFEFSYAGKCRMVRRKWGYVEVQGEWCATQKEAKASYKEALRRSKESTHD